MSEMDDDKPVYLPATQYSQAAMSLHRQLMPDREADKLRAQCMSGGEWEYGRWLMLNPPSPETKQRLEKRHRDIATNLMHHDTKTIAAAVADVIACYRNFVKKDEKASSVITKYVKELHGIPTWACVRACDAIRNNQAPGISLEYPFNTIQLRALAESYIKRLQDEARELSQIMLGGHLPPPAPPEARARIARGMQRLAFRLGSSIERDRRATVKPMLERMAGENENTIIREYRNKGDAPVFAGNFLVSPQLVNQIQQRKVSDASDTAGDEPT